MISKLHARSKDRDGFTLIELLVVILIIGILAAIAIPSFLGQRTKATDASAKANAKTAQTAIETFFTDTQTYVGATPGALVAIEPTLTDAKVLTVPNPQQTTYTVSVQSDRTPASTFTISRDAAGRVTRGCSAPSNALGGCSRATGGSW